MPDTRTPADARTEAAARPTTAGPRLRRASDVVLRVAVLVAAGIAVGWVLWHLRVVVLPVFIAILVCTALTPPVVALERRGLPTLASTWIVFGAAVTMLAGVLLLIVPPTVDQFADLGSALSEGLDDVEQWLVDGPLGLEQEQVRQYTRDPLGQAAEVIDLPSGSIMSGARTAGEVAVGGLLSIVLTFLLLKDGRRFQAAVMDRVPARHRDLWRASAQRAWSACGGFLRGAAVLGVIEGTIIGSTMAIVGAPLALPVALLTLMGAFFPIVGAITAGAIAVLITLAGAGFTPALIVLVVAVAVQQLDNDLLAPFIYGRSLELHPVAVLLALATGATLGGIVGAFVAVPLLGAAQGVGHEVWQRRDLLDRGRDEPAAEPVAPAGPVDGGS